MKKRPILCFTAAAVTVAFIPYIVSRSIENPPDVNKIMAAAISFTANSSFSTETSELGNGNLILYKPILPSKNDAVNSETTETSREPVSEESRAIVTDADEAVEIATSAESPVIEENYIITQNISNDSEDLSSFISKDLKVKKTTFNSYPEGENYILLETGGKVRNCTELENDFVREETKIPSDIGIEVYSDQPQVLIMHTHTCESYLIGDGDYQDQAYSCRTTDPSQSVVAVGQKISEKLAEKGICVIHDGTFHDHPMFNGAYSRAEETINEILNEYPSIKVVLDIHRDGIVEENGTPVAAVNTINGKEAAQVMIISAAADGYYYVPNYLQNFHFACLLQQYMEGENPGITRPVLFQYCNYNQHLTTGSLLLEIGSQGNTLEQALYTGELIGESIGNALLSLSV